MKTMTQPACRGLVTCFAACIAVFPLPGPAAEVRIVSGNLLTVKSERAPLTEILSCFADYGVAVRLDPRVQATVTADFRNADMETAMAQMLGAFDYVMIWNVIQTPLGALPLLSELRVFLKGEPERSLPLSTAKQRRTRTSWHGQNDVEVMEGEIVLRVRPGVSRAQFEQLLSQIGGTVADCIPEANLYRIRVGAGANMPSLLEQLRRNQWLAGAEPNYVFRLVETECPPTSDPAVASLGKISPSPALRMSPVAVLDSGLDPAAGLEELTVGKLDATDPRRPLQDYRGHGTQMALLASGAVRPDGFDPDKNAQRVPIIAIRVFDDEGYSSSFDLARSVAYAVQCNAAVLNMSWSSTADSRFLQDALTYAASRDMVLVAAAGNTPSGQPVYPAAYPGVLAVSATTADGLRWPSSNYGDFVSLSAPAKASLPFGNQGPPGLYAGTSISASVVAHAIGAYRSKHTRATAEEAVENLFRSLSDAGAPGRDPYFGIGTLDQAAFERYLAQ